MIDWDNKEEILRKLSKEDCVKFAIKAANLVSHLSDDPRVMDAIKAAEDWLADPSEKNRKAANAAAYPAWTATSTAKAAASAAASIAFAANWAVEAAYAATSANPNVKHTLIKYLRELYLNSLPEEAKNDWLTRAIIGIDYD